MDEVPDGDAEDDDAEDDDAEDDDAEDDDADDDKDIVTGMQLPGAQLPSAQLPDFGFGGDSTGGLLPAMPGALGLPSAQDFGGFEQEQHGGGMGGGRLEPVLESTERSAFSTVGNLDGEGEGTLGAVSGFGSVKKGFFDASSLGDDDVEATRRELAKCQAELAASRAELAEERRKHTYNVRRMLDANEALQAQLRELNGVVQRIVMKTLNLQRTGAVPSSAVPGGINPPKGGGSSGPFPAMAKPGAKPKPSLTAPANAADTLADHHAPTAPTAPPGPGSKPKQEPPGAKPFK